MTASSATAASSGQAEGLYAYAGKTPVLAVGTFVVGTSGYVVAGLMPALVRELHVSQASAAQLVTAFAIAYAIGAPIFATVLGHLERRRVLAAALAVTALGNLLAAIAPGYALLFGARMVTAIGAAVFTPVASAVAAELNRPERRGCAVATVFGGLTIALILGVPLGGLLSAAFGYRWVFAIVAAVSLLAAVAVRGVLPTVPSGDKIGLAERFAVARDPRVLAILATTVLGVIAAFGVYTFISPLLAATGGITGTAVSVLLFAYGAGGWLGNFVGGKATDRWGSRNPLLVVIGSLTAVLALLPLLATTVAGAGVMLFALGLATWSFNPPMQHRLIELSPHAAGLLLSLNASAIYLGVGLSGVVGGLVLNYAGPAMLPELAAILTAVTVVFVLLGWRARAERATVPAA